MYDIERHQRGCEVLGKPVIACRTGYSLMTR